MELRSFSFAAALLALTAGGAFAQPQQNINCDGQQCTFTLSFDDGLGDPQYIVSGAPWSGQESRVQSNTLANGTHTSITTTGPLTYRDSQGRTRTEQPAFPNRPNGIPAQPGDFTVIEIRDPAAGFQYILDPVTHIAHRMAFKAGPAVKWQSTVTNLLTPSTHTMPNGGTDTNEPLGTKAISGVAALGYRLTTTFPGPDGRTVTRSDEHWVDPRTGVSLLSRHDDSGREFTVTMLNYSSAEPDAALFQIPSGFQARRRDRSVQSRPSALGARPGYVDEQRAGPTVKRILRRRILHHYIRPRRRPPDVHRHGGGVFRP